MQCFECNRWGHTSYSCPRTYNECKRCLRNGHYTNECSDCSDYDDDDDYDDDPLAGNSRACQCVDDNGYCLFQLSRSRKRRGAPAPVYGVGAVTSSAKVPRVASGVDGSESLE